MVHFTAKALAARKFDRATYTALKVGPFNHDETFCLHDMYIIRNVFTSIQILGVCVCLDGFKNVMLSENSWYSKTSILFKFFFCLGRQCRFIRLKILLLNDWSAVSQSLTFFAVERGTSICSFFLGLVIIQTEMFKNQVKELDNEIVLDPGYLKDLMAKIRGKLMAKL